MFLSVCSASEKKNQKKKPYSQTELEDVTICNLRDLISLSSIFTVEREAALHKMEFKMHRTLILIISVPTFLKEKPFKLQLICFKQSQNTAQEH